MECGAFLPRQPFVYRVSVMSPGRALQCYTCVGSSDQDCNRQGTQQCPQESDACAIMRGQSSGVMKSCSYKSFCDRAMRDGNRAPGMRVQCCFSNNCNSDSKGSGSQLSASGVRLLLSVPFLISTLGL
uniref:UPAR/Ly6 domain-containing protein n=1 Tax=Xenopus tropicalis TaxID=8364 RepID=A0A6I8SI92_XENTR